MQVTIKYAKPTIEGYTVHLSPEEAGAFLRMYNLDLVGYGRPLRELLSALKNAGVNEDDARNALRGLYEAIINAL